MKIRGQRFFDMATREKAKFGLPDVASVTMEECEISMIDVETDKIVSSQKLFLVIVVLNDGSFLSTKPLYDQDYAAYIATTLAERCERFNKGS